VPRACRVGPAPVAARADRRPGGRQRGPVEGLTCELSGLRRVTGTQALAGLLHQVCQEKCIHLVGFDAEPVATGLPGHHGGVALGAHPGDQHLQRLERVGRQVVVPDDLDQPGVRDTGGTECERSQEGRRPLPRQSRSPPADVVEQTQGGGHRFSIGASGYSYPVRRLDRRTL